MITKALELEILKAADIVRIARMYTNLKRHRGRHWTGLCPFHTRRSRTFIVLPDEGVFYCRKCGNNGGSVELIMKLTRRSYDETLRYIAHVFGIEGLTEDERHLILKLKRIRLPYQKQQTRLEWERLHIT